MGAFSSVVVRKGVGLYPSSSRVGGYGACPASESYDFLVAPPNSWGSTFFKMQKGKVASQVFYVPMAGDVEHSGPEPGPL